VGAGPSSQPGPLAINRRPGASRTDARRGSRSPRHRRMGRVSARDRTAVQAPDLWPGGSPSSGLIGSGRRHHACADLDRLAVPGRRARHPGHEARRRAPVPRGCVGFECISQACSREPCRTRHHSAICYDMNHEGKHYIIDLGRRLFQTLDVNVAGKTEPSANTGCRSRVGRKGARRWSRTTTWRSSNVSDRSTPI
jgi:hypothetical protein